MQLRLRLRVIHMYPKCSEKPKEVSVKYNVAILTLQIIQSPCGSKLMLDGTDWWMNHSCFRVVLCILGTMAKMLTSFGPVASLSVSTGSRL